MKLKEYRLKNKLSQKELSSIVNIPQTTLFSYETGVCDPSVSTLLKLADFYHISVDELIGRPTNLINKAVLSELEQNIIDKVLKMNAKQQQLTEFYIDTLLSSM